MRVFKEHVFPLHFLSSLLTFKSISTIFSMFEIFVVVSVDNFLKQQMTFFFKSTVTVLRSSYQKWRELRQRERDSWWIMTRGFRFWHCFFSRTFHLDIYFNDVVIVTVFLGFQKKCFCWNCKSFFVQLKWSLSFSGNTVYFLLSNRYVLKSLVSFLGFVWKHFFVAL